VPLLSSRRRTLVLAICCMSLLIVGLDNTIVNVALPVIRRDLHASVSGLQWTVDAYLLVLASLLMLSGSIADRFGRRRIFQLGLVLFTVASLLCSLAPTVELLVVFRMLQAVGGSMLNPVAMGIITNTFTDARERARAIGVWGATIGISQALGPVVGGTLVESVGWRSIFWINIPIGLAAVLLTALFVPESKAARPRRLDPVGQLLVVVALASVVYAIIEGPGQHWGTRIIALFGLAACAVAGLVRYELWRKEPLIDPRFFRSAPFTGATVTAVCGTAGLGGFLFINTLYLQEVRGLSALDAGLRTVPMAAMTMLFAPLSGRIVGTRGSRLPFLLGGAGMAVGGLLLVSLTTDTSTLWLTADYVLFGAGFAMLNTPVTTEAVSGMPSSQAGVAAAVASTSRQIGQSLGVAVLGSIVTSRIHGSLAAGLTPASHLGWWIIACCGVVIAVVGFVTTGRWGRTTAQRAAALVDESSQTIAPAGR
jgi:EmrB/QacA subfamily drug resistance transporter